MPSLSALDELYVETGLLVAASEDFPAGYRKAPKQFAQLLRGEQELDLRLRHYFAGLPGRLIHRVNWLEYHQEVTADELSQAAWDNEADLLVKAIYPSVVKLSEAGAASVNVIHGTAAPLSDAFVQERAANHSLQLAKGLNATTKEALQKSLTTSLKLRETYDQAAERMSDTLDSVTRAETIARTESVKAYQGGVLDMGKATGAVTKTWEVSAGPCPICEALDGTTVGIDQEFPGGYEIAQAHPRCRCNMRLSYGV